MTEEQNQFKFEFVIDREYVKNSMDGNYEGIELSEDQWEDLFYGLDDHIYPAVGHAVTLLLDYAALLERNKDAGKTKPYYIAKYKHPSADVYDWTEIKRRFKTEADAKEYLDYGRPLGVDEEWKIERIE